MASARIAAALVVLAIAGCASRKGPPAEPRPYREVSCGVAFTILRDNPGLLVLDLRDAQEFSGPSGHVAGAHNVPLSEIEGRIRELAPYIGQTILLYCHQGDCAELGARALALQGFRYLLVLAGGIEAWTERGFGLMTPMPARFGDSTAGAFRQPTHARRLATSGLEPFVDTAAPSDLFVAGRLRGERFIADGPVRGYGEFCHEWEARTGERGRHGWVELGDGSFHGPEDFRPPRKPFVTGCRGRDGIFRPDSRDVVY
ncbi:MAG: rhodanese-like domain-containing protein [Thermoanaerobaculia bacterium]